MLALILAGFLLLGALGAVTVNYALTATVTEILPNNTGSASDLKRTVTHDQYNLSGTLNAGSSPPVSLQAQFLLSLSGGAATIDLTNLVGTNNAVVNGTGLKVNIFRVTNLGANDMTFASGAVNGLTIGAGILIPAGASAEFMYNGNLHAIDSTHKTIDVSGTGSQTAQVTIIMG